MFEKLRENRDNPAFYPGDILDLWVHALPAGCAVPGINYEVRKKALTWSSTKYKVYTHERVVLPPSHMTPVAVTRTRGYNMPQYLGKTENLPLHNTVRCATKMNC